MSARPPAEWAPHRACWVAFPGDPELWPELERTQQAWSAMCRGIGRGEILEVLVQREAWIDDARRALTGLDARFHHVPFGDIWLRDTGPVFLEGGTAAGFRWTGWGDKYHYEGDARVAASVAQLAGVALHVSRLAMEGGGLDHDGAGTVLTTAECALSEARNPGLGRVDVESALAEAVGAERVVWIERGLANDHTDGHIDNVARFVAPGTAVCARPSGGDDPNRGVLGEIEATLRAARDASGRALQVVTLPSPGRVVGRGGVLPASHLNFYVANQSVVVPVYGGPEEDEALRTLGELFPGREVVPVASKVFLEEGGAVHCITQQEPAAG